MELTLVMQCVYENQSTSQTLNFSDLTFHIAKRGYQGFKKAFCNLQEALTENSFQTAPVFNKSIFEEIAVEPATLLKMIT